MDDLARDFVDSYCRRSGVGRDWMLRFRKPVPCDCGDATCEGWAMVPLEWSDWRGSRHSPTLRPCRGCDRPVMWCQTAKGSAIPLDPEPVESGNLVVVTGNPDGSGPRLALYARPMDDGPRFVSHFVSCPRASAFRR